LNAKLINKPLTLVPGGALLHILMFMALVALTGCEEDQPARPFEEDDAGCVPVAQTPEQTVLNWVTIMEDGCPQDLHDLYHPDFRNVTSASTLAMWEFHDNPLPGPTWDREDEIRIWENVFAGNSGVQPGGQAFPPIDHISVELLDKQGQWQPVSIHHPYFAGMGAYWVEYNLIMYLADADSHLLKIQQPVNLYVAAFEVSGSEVWQLLGVEPIDPGPPGKSSMEEISLDGFKSLFR
jgi:hypothetical protein